MECSPFSQVECVCATILGEIISQHAMPHLSAGTRLGPYEILSLIGVGGMGEVYKARDTRLDCDVAIKISNEKSFFLPMAFFAVRVS
jgi:serine/threonine protein kinase